MNANQAFVERLAKIATEKHATPVQIALAWLLAQKPWIVPIPGTTELYCLDENVAAATIKLTTRDLAMIDGALSGITVHGTAIRPNCRHA
jgi:aryl-alcohol dehydrogenase-like predicted oxidoreductase